MEEGPLIRLPVHTAHFSLKEEILHVALPLAIDDDDLKRHRIPARRFDGQPLQPTGMCAELCCIVVIIIRRLAAMTCNEEIDDL